MSCAGAQESEPSHAGFILPEVVNFGYSQKYCSKHMRVEQDGKSAYKENPASIYAHGVAYGSRPVKGHCEFEVELTSYGTGWSGNLKLGIMRTSGKLEEETIPRYSPEASGYCIWCAGKLHDHMIAMTEMPYGKQSLDELQQGDRLGLQLTRNGVLTFFINGHPQGVAASSVYSKKDCDVYVVVDHYANCKSTQITRAGRKKLMIMLMQCSVVHGLLYVICTPSPCRTGHCQILILIYSRQ